MEVLQQIYLLLICQGFYLGSVCQRWTFPSEITALIGSCVEIPCSYRPANTSEISSTVWYLKSNMTSSEIFNAKDSSSVMEKYRDRTSLVPGDNSCTLRIDPVTREDDHDIYYAGIAENRNISTYTQNHHVVRLYADTGKFGIDAPELMTEGKATTMRCSIEHSCSSTPPFLQWNKHGQIKNKSEDIYEGVRREESQLTYFPSYVDDESLVVCTVIYHNGRKNMTSKMLNINYAPKYVTIVEMDKVKEGSDVTLQCNSVSRPDVSEYEWYKGETSLPDRGREMTVRSVTRDMEPYSCAARNTVGRGESIPTKIFGHHIYTDAKINVTVIRMDEVMEGCDVTLQCNSFSRPDVSEYEWYKGETRLPDRGREMTVRNVTRDMEPYSCAARNTVGRGESAPLQIPVKYTGKFGIDVPEIMTEGKATTMICSIEHSCSSTPPSLQWNKDGQIEKKSVNISQGTRGEELQLMYIPSYVDDKSLVVCTVIYHDGQKNMTSSTLNINYAPKHVTVIVMDKVMEGNNVTLQCNSVSRPDVSEYEWYIGKTRLPDRGREMTVKNVTPGHMEPYSCAARNTVGRGESTPILIPVIYMPTDEDPGMRTIILPAVTVMTVGFCLLLPLLLGYFCWRKRCHESTTNEVEIQPQSIYTDLVSRNDENEYTELKPPNPTHITFKGEPVDAVNSYENTEKKISKNND